MFTACGIMHGRCCRQAAAAAAVVVVVVAAVVAAAAVVVVAAAAAAVVVVVVVVKIWCWVQIRFSVSEIMCAITKTYIVFQAS